MMDEKNYDYECWRRKDGVHPKDPGGSQYKETCEIPSKGSPSPGRARDDAPTNEWSSYESHAIHSADNAIEWGNL